MATTNVQSATPRNRNPRAFSYSFAPDEERRRDAILRSAFMSVVAPFTCRPEPRGPWDETNTGDITPWSYPLGLMRNAMATAAALGDREKINATMEGVRNFCRELEADIASMVPPTEEASIITLAMAETEADGPSNQASMALVAHPDPITADRAIKPFERQYERLGALIKKCRRAARQNSTALALVIPAKPMSWALAGRMTVWTIAILAGMVGIALIIGRRLHDIDADYPELTEEEEQDYEEGTTPPRAA